MSIHGLYPGYPNLPLDIIVMIADLGGPILRYKLSVCSSTLNRLIKRLPPQRFIAEKFPASQWHLDDLEFLNDTKNYTDIFKDAKPAITEYLIQFLSREFPSLILNTSGPRIQLSPSSRQQYETKHRSKTDKFKTRHYTRMLDHFDMGGIGERFWIEQNDTIRRYIFDPMCILNFETYEYFDQKNTLVLTADDPKEKLVQVERYHLIIRFDRLNRIGYFCDDGHTLSAEEKLQRRNRYFENSLREVFTTLLVAHKLEHRFIQTDPEQKTIHVTFEL